ncbi:MAG: hypothetical protein RBS35_08780 [Azonexus sp.]|jgi:hypothetical protein|nr:hypothetical protein [Azonexus sp.]
MQKPNDIVSFPELFDGMEQFLAEQIGILKRASLITSALAIAYLLNSLFQSGAIH